MTHTEEKRDIFGNIIREQEDEQTMSPTIGTDTLDEEAVSSVPVVPTERKTRKGGKHRRTDKKRPTSDGDIKISRHGAEMIQTRNLQKEEQMLSRLTTDTDVPLTYEERIQNVMNAIAYATGIELPDDKRPDRIGFNLANETQKNVLFAILKRMTETNYKGDFQVPNRTVISRTYKDSVSETIDKPVKALQEGFTVASQHIGGAYQNVLNIPTLRITPSDIARDVIQITGIEETENTLYKITANVKEAVAHLASDMHFLMWTRFKRNDKGKVVRNKNGKTEFELVSTFSPVLNVNFVSDENKQGLSYYEISPSSVFLDEVSRDYGSKHGGYCIMIPDDFNRQIDRATYPIRNTSPFIKSFCWWLRLRFADINAKNQNVWKKNKTDYTIRIGFVDLCKTLNFAESTYMTAKKRTLNTLRKGIEISQKIGYLLGEQEYIQSGITTYEEETDMFTFILNPDYYPHTEAQGDGPT